MIITVNFEPLLRVFVKYLLAKKSTMNTKGMSLLTRGSQGNINYWPQSSDSVLGFWPASTSELLENQRNDLVFFKIIPSHFFRASEASKIDRFKN
jgi:hypothetical protein